MHQNPLARAVHRLFVPLAVSWVGLLHPAAANPDSVGGSASDYERAAVLRQSVRGTVRNERIEPLWLGDSALVVRLETGPDSWRWISIDRRTGRRGPAFDHAAVAREIATSIAEPWARELSPEALPITLSTPGDGRLIATVRSAVVIEIEAGTSTVSFLDDDPAVNDPRMLPSVAVRRSRDDGGETHVRFVNASSGAVDLQWVDRSGATRSYGTIAAGESRSQHTFAGHAWRLVGEGGMVLGSFRARRTLGIARVTDTSRVPDPPPSPRESTPRTFVRDHDLWWRDRVTGEDVALTNDGTPENPYTDRVTWSPDESRLVVMRVEPSQGRTISFVDSAPDDRLQPRVITQRYLKPGDRIEHPRPVVIDVERRVVTPIDDAWFPTPWSISRVTWAPDNSGFWFLYNERGHRVVRLLHVDAISGAVRPVIREEPETFVDYAGKLHLTLMPESGEAVWMSERSGWNHLYLANLEGDSALAPITGGSWVVRAVDEIDRTARTIRFRAMGVRPGQDPYHVHHGVVSFDGGPVRWLTEGDGMHQIEFAPDGASYIDTWSRVDLAPVHELRRTRDGALLAEIARADWSELLETGWRPPERFTAPGRDGRTSIHGIIFTPSNFDPARSYPVIENIYAGPHSHFVPKSFSAWHGSREIAELGFVVVRIDGMGTNWRSKSFHDVAWKNLGDSGFPDRIPWMQAAAAERPWMDLDRVGIYGGSAGGQSALRAMLIHGDFYDAAVADCGCHDNRMDKIWWNELWMSWPIGDHYAEQSNVTQAHRLEGELLLIVGEVDRNVDPASTMQVVDALIAADKDFDLLVMPGVGHGAAETPYGKRRRADFFVRRLLGAEPRWAPAR